MSQASSSPPADAVAGLVPPAASTVTTSASASRSVQQGGFRGAQRGAVQRHRPSAGGLDRVAEGVHVPGVPGQMLGAVVQHGDGGSVRDGGSLQHAPGGGALRRLEAVAGEQYGVGQEPVQLSQVGGATLGQVVVRVGSDARGDRGEFHQLGVRRHLAAERDDRPAAARTPRRCRPPRRAGRRGSARSRGRRWKAEPASPPCSSRAGFAQR